MGGGRAGPRILGPRDPEGSVSSPLELGGPVFRPPLSFWTNTPSPGVYPFPDPYQVL